MKQARALSIAHRLISKHGAPTSWTRKFLASGGASGVTVETKPAQTVSVLAVAVEAGVLRSGAPEWWTQATTRLLIEAQALPFNPDPQFGASPGVQFSDVVIWGGVSYRVIGVYKYEHGDPAHAAKPYCYLVGLAA